MTDNSSKNEGSLFSSLVYRFIPYWPLFTIMLTIAVAGAWAYLNLYATPSYLVTASLVIKDEKKGVSDSRMTESFDAFTSSNIVENEIKVIHSRSLMRSVVNKLGLYAPVFQEGKFRLIPAYTSSPIKIEHIDPENATQFEAVYFTFDNDSKKVEIDSRLYPLDEWVQSPYGTLRFTLNESKSADSEFPLFFSIVKPKVITDQLINNINIQASSKFSTVVDISLSDPEPKRGEDIINNLILSYKQLAVTEREKLAANTLEFVEDRIKSVVEELQELESDVVQFKSTQGSINLSEQGKLYLENVRDNDRKISEINTQLAILDKVRNYVESKNNTAGIVPSTLGVHDPILSQLLQKLYNSEIQYQKLKATTAENNPVLISLNDEIQNIRPSILENIRNQRDNLYASKANLIATNSSYNATLQTIPQKERELMELSRQQTIKNNAYSFLLQKREETVLSYAPTAGDSRIVDMADSSAFPVSPKSLYIYVIAFMLACSICIGFITAKESMNTKILFRSEIEEYTSAPIVSELTFVKPPKDSATFSSPTEAAVIEQFRQMRATMGLYGRTFSKKKILVTSSIPGEGKSYVSSNLAFSLATSGKKVLLLDFDLRNPNTSHLFDKYKQSGLIEYLKDETSLDSIIYETPFENLKVASAGINIGDHTELLLNGKLEGLFSCLELTYDYIILDTPPVDLVSDAYLLSEFCDITLLVIRHGYTPKNLIKRLPQDNKIKSLNNVAIVFNGVKPRGFVKGQYGYGYGYGYENKYNDKTYRARNAVAKA
jgi:tyrosine-protein kinase Etk/Wzc